MWRNLNEDLADLFSDYRVNRFYGFHIYRHGKGSGFHGNPPIGTLGYESINAAARAIGIPPKRVKALALGKKLRGLNGAKEVTVNGTTYESIAAAAKATKKSPMTIRKLLK